MEEIRTPGKTTIAPHVLIDIAEMATLKVTGVSKMGKLPASSNFLKKSHNRNGIQVSIENAIVSYEIFVEVIPDANIQLIAKNIQDDISAMMTKMVGMELDKINIHITNVDYATSPQKS